MRSTHHEAAVVYELHGARTPARRDEGLDAVPIRQVTDPAEWHRGGGRRRRHET